LGSKSKAPDYTPIANASEEAARYGKQAADDQLAFAKEQYADYKPIIDQITGAQLGLMNEQLRQGQDYYDYMQQQYRPLETEMVNRVKEYNTEAYREQLAQQAAADAGLAFQNTQAMNERAMASMGVNPNSGRYAGLNRASELGLAEQRANAMTGTRQQAQAYGDAMLTNTVGVGRGLVGAANGAYGMAMNAGNSASGNSMAAGNNLYGQMGQAYGLAQTGQQMQMQGLGNILSSQTSIYANQSDPLMGALGIGAGLLGKSAWWTSDRRLKQDIVVVGEHPNGLPAYEFAYKHDPTRRFIGVMADDVEKFMPEAVTEVDGYKTVDYNLLGITMQEVTHG